jgi:hypothetical protein
VVTIEINLIKFEMSNKTKCMAMSKGIDLGAEYKINNDILPGMILMYDDNGNIFRYKI